jgi:predicted nucleic-acid-binding protein
VRILDTNVVIRLLVGDDPQQTPIAERAFLDAISTGGVHLSDGVQVEVAWSSTLSMGACGAWRQTITAACRSRYGC